MHEEALFIRLTALFSYFSQFNHHPLQKNGKKSVARFVTISNISNFLIKLPIYHTFFTTPYSSFPHISHVYFQILNQ